MNSAPVATVALAGHITVGNGAWCECDTDNCTCDPGEMKVGSQPTPAQSSTNDTPALPGVDVANGFDPGAGVMLFTLALLLGLRMRF
jgi:hypothetical protein